jgi:hypothetical protein
VDALLNSKKGESLKFRLVNEDVLAANGRAQLMLGWGRQGRALYDRKRHIQAVPDSLWIYVFLSWGAAGLVVFAAIFAIPLVRFLSKHPGTEWMKPQIAPAAAMAVVLVLWITDSLANALVSPILLLAVAGLGGDFGSCRSSEKSRVELTAD